MSELQAAHKHCSKHRDEILASDMCGCFYCLHMFPPSKIVEWIHEEATAMCPRCGIDSVLGSASGLSLDAAFLEQMRNYWFSERYARAET